MFHVSISIICSPGELGSGELPHTLLNFSRQICMGLTYLSEKGFVHRDIAARNILVATNSVCKVCYWLEPCNNDFIVLLCCA